MEVKINIPIEKCIELLKKNGYDVIEKKLGYYLLDYHINKEIYNKKSCYVECTYKSTDKPEAFIKEEPSVEELETYSLENTVRRLINEKFIDLILNKD